MGLNLRILLIIGFVGLFLALAITFKNEQYIMFHNIY